VACLGGGLQWGGIPITEEKAMTLKCVPCLLGSLAVIALGPPTVDAATYDLYYLGGQSNMDGYGNVADLPAELQGTVEGVMIFHGNPAPDSGPADGRGAWAELRPGHGAGYEHDGETPRYSDRFGVELTFARTLRELEPEARIALVKYSRGGTSIDRAAAGTFGCWDPDLPGDGDAGVNQYDHFLATVRNATVVRDIDGDGEADTLVPRGIVWMQGESDAAYTRSIAEQYGDHLRRLMDLVRAALRVDDLPVVVGRISDSGHDEEEGDGKVWNHGDVVRAAQASYVFRDRHAALVTSTDDYAYSDKWHYDSAGFMDLGREFATAIHRLRVTAASGVSDPDPRRYENEIAAFTEWDAKNGLPEAPVLFVGSSSIRHWSTASSFPGCEVLNRGFGGAQISDVLHYYREVVGRYHPSAIVVYAGDNDVWEGKSPSRILNDLETFVQTVRRDQPSAPIYFIAIKPSLRRWGFWKTMEETNALVRAWAESRDDVVYVDVATPMLEGGGPPPRELFIEDGLHLSERGYAVWDSVLGPHVATFCSAAAPE
jgi:lysophospholipase L1-like esterase